MIFHGPIDWDCKMGVPKHSQRKFCNNFWVWFAAWEQALSCRRIMTAVRSPGCLRQIACRCSCRVVQYDVTLTVLLWGWKFSSMTPCMFQNMLSITLWADGIALNFLVYEEITCFHSMEDHFNSVWNFWTHDSSPVTICAIKSSLSSLYRILAMVRHSLNFWIQLNTAFCDKQFSTDTGDISQCTSSVNSPLAAGYRVASTF